MNAIEVKNLSVGYGTNSVITEANFTLKQGDYMFIIGGNGSGKSTLIKTILGILEPLEGQLKLFEQNFSQALIAQKFAYVPQYTKIKRDFPISVREVIQLECRLSKRVCKLHPEGHLKEFGAVHLVDRKLSDLSGGEFQKVLIARALVTDPEVLVLDEPTNNLDTQAMAKLKEILANLNKEKRRTIIVVTHDYVQMYEKDENKRIFFINDNKINEQDQNKIFNKGK
jgi:zinc transport system ATP-binding protein